MLDFFGTIGSLIMTPLYYAISAVMLAFHSALSTVLPSDAGITWLLSIVGLTLVIRAALIPLFVKQIKSSRNMALLQPKVRELQKKYKHDRERLAQETMKLYKDAGTNPFASCLPILVQMPVFLALFRLIDQASRNGRAHGLLNEELAQSLGGSQVGNIPIARTFIDNGGVLSVSILAAVLVVAMTATTFLTQRQLMSKNMPPEALSGPYAQQQKMLLYVLPFVFAIGGVFFPIGVLVYWTTSNLWTMSQQFYVIRRNPAPGTPAAAAKAERDAAKAKRKGEAAPEAPGTTLVEEEPEERRPRQQPQRKPRSQRSGGGNGAAKPGPKPGPKAAGNKGGGTKGGSSKNKKKR